MGKLWPSVLLLSDPFPCLHAPFLLAVPGRLGKDLTTGVDSTTIELDPKGDLLPTSAKPKLKHYKSKRGTDAIVFARIWLLLLTC